MVHTITLAELQPDLALIASKRGGAGPMSHMPVRCYPSMGPQLSMTEPKMIPPKANMHIPVRIYNTTFQKATKSQDLLHMAYRSKNPQLCC